MGFTNNERRASNDLFGHIEKRTLYLVDTATCMLCDIRSPLQNPNLFTFTWAMNKVANNFFGDDQFDKLAARNKTKNYLKRTVTFRTHDFLA